MLDFQQPDMDNVESSSTASEAERPNYHAIEPDPSKRPAEYTTAERRADVLDHILSRGSPSAISQSRLAERYEVAQSTVSRDVDVLGEAVNEQLGDRLRLATVALHDKLVADLSEADDWRAKQAAWSIHMDLVEWTGVSAGEDEAARTASSQHEHELTDTQRQHLGELREQARAAISERGSAGAVPDADCES